MAGEYHVRVIPESGANDDDVFSLWAELGPSGQVFLAADAPVPPEGESAEYAYPYLTYLPGDANADSYRNLADVVHLLNYLFRDEATPNPMEAGDCDCDGSVDLGDAMHLLNYLFKEGPPPGC